MIRAQEKIKNMVFIFSIGAAQAASLNGASRFVPGLP